MGLTTLRSTYPATAWLVEGSSVGDGGTIAGMPAEYKTWMVAHILSQVTLPGEDDAIWQILGNVSNNMGDYDAKKCESWSAQFR